MYTEESSQTVKPYPLSEFTFQKKKRYQDKEGNDWHVKFEGNVESLLEVLASHLHRLLAGENHIPEVLLLKGINPETKQEEYAVASKIIKNYVSYPNINHFSYDNKNNLLIEAKPYSGLERLAIVSCILGEGDFSSGGVGGNIGVSINSDDCLNFMRIDFGVNPFAVMVAGKDFNNKTAHFNQGSFVQCNTVNELFKIIDAGVNNKFNLVSGDNAREAIKNISEIPNEKIDDIFSKFLPCLEDAINLEIAKYRASSEDPHFIQQKIEQLSCYKENILLAQKTVKANKDKLMPFFARLRDPVTAPTQQFNKKADIPSISIAVEDVKIIEEFYEMYHSFNGFLIENYVKRKTNETLSALSNAKRRAEILNEINQIKTETQEQINKRQRSLEMLGGMLIEEKNQNKDKFVIKINKMLEDITEQLQYQNKFIAKIENVLKVIHKFNVGSANTEEPNHKI